MTARFQFSRLPVRLNRHYHSHANRCWERALGLEGRTLHKNLCGRNAHTYAWPVDFVPFELHAGGLRNIFRTLEEDFQQMRNKVISQHPAARTRMGFAAADIQESEKQVSLRLDLPGLSKEDIKVHLGKDRRLTISGHRQATSQADTAGRLQQTERSHGEFRRDFHLPQTVDTSTITAKAENGVLTIQIQKAPEAVSEIAVA